MSSAPAIADDGFLALGAFVGVGFGNGTTVIWGGDTHLWIEPLGDSGMVFGPGLRILCRGVSSVDFVGKVGVMHDTGDVVVAPDIGLSLRVGANPGELVGFDVGALLTGDSLGLLGRLRLSAGPTEGALGFGPWHFVGGDEYAGECGGYGRPLRVDTRVLRPPLVVNLRENVSISRDTNTALATAWLDDVRSEAASVPAFLALAQELADAGAPRSLLRRAQNAACDEIRHTALCARMAQRYAPIRVATPIFAPPRRALGRRREALRRLAVETFRDGCLGEGEAAARARRAAQQSVDVASQRAYALIAKDEQAHAELGWDILRWTLAAGGHEVREAIRAELGDPKPYGSSAWEEWVGERRAWAAHGQLNRTCKESLREQISRTARARVLALLPAR